MATAICTNSDQVLWSHWHALATAIDNLAVTLNTPGYTNLVDDDTLPFIVDNLPQVEGVIHFTVTPGAQKCTDADDAVPYDNEANCCPVITDIQLLTDFVGSPPSHNIDFVANSFTGLDTYDFIKQYADNDRLYFVHEEDDCWCKTIFKIVPAVAAGHYRLQAVPGASPKTGCCQTLNVANVGERLDSAQDIIPSAYSCMWGDLDGIQENTTPGTDTDFAYDNPMYCPDCKHIGGPPPVGAGGCLAAPSPDHCEYHFVVSDPVPPAAEGDYYVLDTAARYIKGYLTWPILEEHMEALFTKLRYILHCSRNDGLRPAGRTIAQVQSDGGVTTTYETAWRHDSTYDGDGGYDTASWFLRGSTCGPPDIDPWLASLNFEFTELIDGSLFDPAAAGTIVDDASNVENISNDLGTMLRPWEQNTGNATELCNSRPRVYCRTINQLNDFIVDILGTRVWPYGSFVFSPVSACICTDTVPCCYESGTPGQKACDDTLTESECRDLDGTIITGCADPEIYECCSDTACSNAGGNISLGTGTCECDYNQTYDCCCEDLAGCSECFGPYTDTFDCATHHPGVTCSRMGECSDADSCDALVSCCQYDGGTDTYTCTDYVGYKTCVDGGGVPFGDGGGTYCLIAGTGAPAQPCDEVCSDTAFGNPDCSDPQPNVPPFSTTCTDNSQAPPVPDPYTDDMYVPLTPTTGPMLGSCDRPCCLEHPSFSATASGCVEYLEEVQALMEQLFLGTKCGYTDPRILDATAGGSAPYPNDCNEITCDGYTTGTIPADIVSCMEQARLLWSTYDAGCAGMTCYNIVITAGAAP